MWRVIRTREFNKGVKRLEGPAARQILTRLYALADLTDPAVRCKRLTGPLKGLWRLRVGDYRVILDIRASELVVVALEVGHRSDIYLA